MDIWRPQPHRIVKRSFARASVLSTSPSPTTGLEGLVSIGAGLIAGSVSLIGFGLDSVIEVFSGAALLWRLHHDLNRSRREQVERTTLRIVGWCFVSWRCTSCTNSAPR
jgi:hypothetical protein